MLATPYPTKGFYSSLHCGGGALTALQLQLVTLRVHLESQELMTLRKGNPHAPVSDYLKDPLSPEGPIVVTQQCLCSSL